MPIFQQHRTCNASSQYLALGCLALTRRLAAPCCAIAPESRRSPHHHNPYIHTSHTLIILLLPSLRLCSENFPASPAAWGRGVFSAPGCSAVQHQDSEREGRVINPGASTQRQSNEHRQRGSETSVYQDPLEEFRVRRIYFYALRTTVLWVGTDGRFPIRVYNCPSPGMSDNGTPASSVDHAQFRAS